MLREAENGSRNLEVAQSLAGDFGWSVYPVSDRKLPLWSKLSKFPNGSRDASSDEKVIEELFDPWPYALVAVRLDYSGLMAVDVDNAHSARKMVLELDLPCQGLTVGQYSLSGRGWHSIFKAPNFDIKKNLKQYPSIDFLFHHYIVLSGHWMRGRSPWECEVKQLASRWLDSLKEQPRHLRAVPQTESDDPLREVLPTQYIHDIAGLTVNNRGFVSCPAHEDWRPSLKVYDTAEAGWFCYQCNRGGSIYDFAALAMGLDSEWGGDTFTAAKVIESVYALYERLWNVKSEF